MADIQIKITNLPEIRSAFRQSPVLMTRELNKAIKSTTVLVQRRSMMNTPVDTGRLRASHYTKFSPLRGEVGTNTEYDIFVHEGTRFMKSRPYLRKAVEGSPEIDGFFTDAVNSVLSEIGKRT